MEQGFSMISEWATTYWWALAAIGFLGVIHVIKKMMRLTKRAIRLAYAVPGAISASGVVWEMVKKFVE